MANTSSTSISETVSGSHKYKITGYSLTNGIGAGNFKSSEVFTVGGHDWAIYFYPDGKNAEDSSMYVSVYIALVSEGTDVMALFELTLLDQSGNERHKVMSNFDPRRPYRLNHQGSMWGKKRFYRRKNLDTSVYLKNDCLIMNCTVSVVTTRLEGPQQDSIPVPLLDMCRELTNFLETEVGCDIAFQVGNETFKAHKQILAARSPVFRAQFFGPAGDPNLDKVVVEDVDPSIFKEIRLFIYSDKLPEVHDIMSTSPNRLLHLLDAAGRYCLDRLKLFCEAKLCEEVNADTVATMFELAEQYYCPQLKDICLKFAATPANRGAVMQSQGFRHLEESCPSLAEMLLARNI